MNQQYLDFDGLNYYNEKIKDTYVPQSTWQHDGVRVAYIQDANGYEDSVEVRYNPHPMTIMWRSSGGRSKIGYPKEWDDIASKGYVDNTVNNIPKVTSDQIMSLFA